MQKFHPGPAATGDYLGRDNNCRDCKTSIDISLNDSPAIKSTAIQSPAWPAIDWTAALDQHRRWLTSVLRSRISNSHVVEDLYQEMSLAVLKQTARPLDPEKVAPWLYRLAVRYSINFHRRNGRQKRLKETVQQQALVGTTRIDDSTDPLRWLVKNEQRQLVADSLDQLAKGDREILMLKYTENWSYQQLAEHLGVTSGTIEYRLLRARKRLRRLLCEANLNPETQAVQTGSATG